MKIQSNVRWSFNANFKIIQSKFGENVMKIQSNIWRYKFNEIFKIISSNLMIIQWEFQDNWMQIWWKFQDNFNKIFDENLIKIR